MNAVVLLSASLFAACGYQPNQLVLLLGWFDQYYDQRDDRLIMPYKSYEIILLVNSNTCYAKSHVYVHILLMLVDSLGMYSCDENIECLFWIMLQILHKIISR